MKSPALIFDNCKFSENYSSFLCLYIFSVDFKSVALLLHLFRLILTFYFLKRKNTFLISDFLCFEIIVFEGHSSLHAGKLFTHRQTHHHSTATFTVHLMVRLRFDLLSKWLEVFLWFLSSRSLFLRISTESMVLVNLWGSLALIGVCIEWYLTSLDIFTEF